MPVLHEVWRQRVTEADLEARNVIIKKLDSALSTEANQPMRCASVYSRMAL